ncbi:MAG: agmatine deiminase family protein [Parasphingorhabdus sp.]|nr:agmatine deiminase family protein [Parasphingorhabdus sp.]
MMFPAEWGPHVGVWIGFPGDPAEWPAALLEAQAEVAAFANAMGGGEAVFLVCRNDTDADVAQRLASPAVTIISRPFGDIWLRDTGPIIVTDGGEARALRFGFNGWGGKYVMSGDQEIGAVLAADRGLTVQKHDWILEGGAIDVDGAGWLVTTEQCLLNPNRNPGLTKTVAEAKLRDAFGVKRILWLGDGLVADHTDGHVDNLARFVGPGTIMIPVADQPDDPNAAIFTDAADRARADGLEVIALPSVGRFTFDGEIAPASYANFFIGNTVVAVPQYGAANDAAAVMAVAQAFPDRKVMGLPASALLRGGGSFHCCSQQIPVKNLRLVSVKRTR